MRLRSQAPEETQGFASALAAALDATGAILLLCGPLGAGKTQFVKGLAAGLGLPAERVQSPTFVVAQELPLPSGGTLVHVDCYRVANQAELESAGLLDWLAPRALVVVEWADRLPHAWPEDRLEILLTRPAQTGTQRDLEARAHGPSSAALLARWRARLGFHSQGS